MDRNRMIKRVFLISLFVLIMLHDRRSSSPRETQVETTIQVDMDDDYTLSYIVPDNGEEEDEVELVFCHSIEEAVESWEPDEYAGINRIDVRIKEFESEDKALLFYIVYTDKNHGYFVIAKFQKRVTEQGTEYAIVGICPSKTSRYGVTLDFTFKDEAKGFIVVANMASFMGYTLAEEGEKFVWGASRWDEAVHMTIDGQAPDEVISYEEFGKTRYFWYYENLESDASLDDLQIECVK